MGLKKQLRAINRLRAFNQPRNMKHFFPLCIVLIGRQPLSDGGSPPFEISSSLENFSIFLPYLPLCNSLRRRSERPFQPLDEVILANTS